MTKEILVICKNCNDIPVNRECYCKLIATQQRGAVIRVFSDDLENFDFCIGFVNQKGEIQPIGGVNQKIEGFFDVCKAKGTNGEQGVMIPHQNIRHLMLREDVVKAVQDGHFHIYSVRNIDEGMEILTGMPAGVRQDDGTYPQGTVNYLVNMRLGEYAQRMKDFIAFGEDAV